MYYYYNNITYILQAKNNKNLIIKEKVIKINNIYFKLNK